MREDSDGVICLDDSESENESSDEPQYKQPQRRNGGVKSAPTRQFAPRARQSAIQASAVTAAIVDVANESSESDMSDDESDLEAVRYAAKPRGRTKASAKKSRSAARKQPLTPRSSTKMSYAEYSKKRGLAHSAPREENDDVSSSSERERPRKRKRGRARPLEDSDEDSERESKRAGSFNSSDSNDEIEPRRLLGKPAYRPSSEPSRSRAQTTPPTSRSTTTHSQANTKQHPKPKQPQHKKAATPNHTSVSTALTSLALRQSEQFSEVVSFSELQAQQRALARFHAQKKRAVAALAATSSSSARKGEPSFARKASTSAAGPTSHNRSNNMSSSVTHVNGTKRAKPRTKIAAKKAPVAPSAELVVRASSMRSAPSSGAQSSHSTSKAETSAGIPSIPGRENKHVAPVIHSTSWRGVYFTHAPPNLLTEVKTIPYSPALDLPLSAYDETGTLAEKIAIVEEVSIDSSTEDSHPSETASKVRVTLESERALIEKCHLRRVRDIIKTTRMQVGTYLRAIRTAHHDPNEPLRRWDLAYHHQPLGLAPIERATARQMLEKSSPPEKATDLDGTICYYIQIGEAQQNPLPPAASVGVSPSTQLLTEIPVYPETVIHLVDSQTPLRRASAYIGVIKSVFIEDDPVLRYVPYFGEHAQMSIDPNRYSATTLDKQKRITVLGGDAASSELKFIEPSARDLEVTEYLLRAVVRQCGRSDQVFDALCSVTAAATSTLTPELEKDAAEPVRSSLASFRFVQPKQDYNDIVEWLGTTRRARERQKEIQKIVRLREEGAKSEPSSVFLAEFARECWYLKSTSDADSLSLRLEPPVTNLASNYVEFPQTSGIRDSRDYDYVKEWYRDLFCRRCYSYDCEEHGIIQPGPCHRVDPILPATERFGINPTQRPEATKVDDEKSSKAEVIELDGSVSESEEEESIQQNEEKQDEQKDDGLDDDEDDDEWMHRRRSVRSQTRISSMATASLRVQEEMVERERRRHQTEVRRRLKQLLRSDDDSEYVDGSLFPVIKAQLDRLQSGAAENPCSSSCRKSANEPENNDQVTLSAVDEMLLRKLSSSLKTHDQSAACLLAALVKRPSLSCQLVAKFLKDVARQRTQPAEVDANISAESEGRDQRRRNKHDKRRRSSSLGASTNGNRYGKRASTAASNANALNRGKEHRYIPCSHPGPCVAGDNDEDGCSCISRDHKCGRACSCPRECPHRSQGCKCAPGTCRSKSCPCYSNGRECDPDYCFSCGASAAVVLAFRPSGQSPSDLLPELCGNISMLRGRMQKKVGVAFSATHGWGAFALEPIRKGDFVYEYVGGVVSDDEAERRGSIYEMLAVSYLFDVNAEQVVDAMRQGNKIKFANHRASSDNANCETKISIVNGEHRIALYARQDIELGEELFFDYGYTHDSAPAWSQRDIHHPHRWGENDDEAEDEDLDEDWRCV